MLGIWVFWGLELYLEYSRIQFCTLVPTKNSSEYAPWIIKVDKTIGLCSRLNHRNRHFFVVWDLSCCWTNKNLDPHEIKLLLKKGHYNLLMPAVCNKFQVTPEILFQQWSSAQKWPCVIFLSVKLSMIKLIISQRTKDEKSMTSMTSHTHTIHGAGIFHYIYHLKTTTIHGSLNIQIVPWMDPSPPSQTSLPNQALHGT